MDDDLERFTTGDADAFEMLFRQYQGEVYRWIVRIVRHPAVAEELTVETFRRIYCQRQRFDAGRPCGPWARRIAIHLANRRLRRVAPVAAGSGRRGAADGDGSLLPCVEVRRRIFESNR